MKNVLSTRLLAGVSLLSAAGIASGCGSSTQAQTNSLASQVQVVDTAAQAFCERRL